jgi:hypothetical protein
MWRITTRFSTGRSSSSSHSSRREKFLLVIFALQRLPTRGGLTTDQLSISEKTVP